MGCNCNPFKDSTFGEKALLLIAIFGIISGIIDMVFVGELHDCKPPRLDIPVYLGILGAYNMIFPSVFLYIISSGIRQRVAKTLTDNGIHMQWLYCCKTGVVIFGINYVILAAGLFASVIDESTIEADKHCSTYGSYFYYRTVISVISIGAIAVITAMITVWKWEKMTYLPIT